MIDLVKTAMLGQYEATLAMLRDSMIASSEETWNGPIASHLFCQTAFHALFFADLYLGQNVDALKRQAFHQENPMLFRDYEEMEARKPEQRYERDDLLPYLLHVLAKARVVMSEETEASLARQAGFPWLPLSRLELHAYNLRHLQHHTAQLSLRDRLEDGEDVRWWKTGWPTP